MPLYLAVDAGGTSTTYVLADERREVARAHGGSIKRMRVAAEVAHSNLSESLDDLERRSGLSLRSLTRTCIGAAGSSVPLVAKWLMASFAARVSGEVLLLGDVEIALDAAFRGGRGVLVLAGTGSNVAARTADGRLTGAGGWGPVVGDEGSGHAIGKAAVRAVFHATDAALHTILAERIAAFWQVDVSGFIERVNTPPLPDFAALVPLVYEAAMEQDSVALSVLREAGEELADTALLAIDRLRDLEQSAAAIDAQSTPPPPVALAGSILRHVAPVSLALRAALEKALPGIHVEAEIVEPVQGALWRARLPEAR